jgi:hypothetical protein
MFPLSLRNGNQPSIVSQLRVKRFHQELANAHNKLEEYEELSEYSDLTFIQRQFNRIAEASCFTV